MRCVVCKLGETLPGKTSVTLDRGQMTLVFKGVPAEICQNCGEAYVANDLSRQLLPTAEQASSLGVQVDVREFVDSRV
jgi:YgiT-type zinc finger domain-containing protein